jgi:hypothetical protein
VHASATGRTSSRAGADQDSADELPAATAKVAISSKPIAKPAKSKWAEEDAVEAVKVGSRLDLPSSMEQ